MAFLEENPKQPTLTTNPSEKSFYTVVHRDYIGNVLREQLLCANALIVPNEGYGDRTGLTYFPAGTSELHQFLVEKQDKNFAVDVCIEEKDYKELALHADGLILAEFVVKEIVAPLLVALLAGYIIQRLGTRIGKTNVKSKLTVVDEKDRHRIEYYYEGPALEYQEVMINAISNFAESKVLQPGGKSKRSRHSKKKHDDE